MDMVFLSPATIENGFYAFRTSDLVGQAIVVMLFFGSMFTWTIMIEKGIALYRAKKASFEFIRRFREKSYPLHLLTEAERNPGPVARIYENGATELMTFYGLTPDQALRYGTDPVPVQKLSTAEIETVRSSLERAVSDQILHIEDRIGLLATAVSVSPFFGLFGTVWGVMVAFCSMAMQGRADIGAMAPGVAGALLTTVVGLLVAIPSLIGYNLLTNTIRQITVSMDNFVEEFMAQVKLEQH
jgi:biopolymer transport protein ExbB/TolQ